jgi:multidrug resistance efflux pump
MGNGGLARVETANAKLQSSKENHHEQQTTQQEESAQIQRKQTKGHKQVPNKIFIAIQNTITSVSPRPPPSLI